MPKDPRHRNQFSCFDDEPTNNGYGHDEKRLYIIPIYPDDRDDLDEEEIDLEEGIDEPENFGQGEI